MLVSGGQILAIDHVVKNDTLVGDGSTKPLGVNTAVIATTALVSATSAKLQDEIDAVSSNFDNYYTKNETSAASEISAALEGVIRHETEVSAADNTIDVSSATLPDGTVVYKIKASSTTNIIGVDPISAELSEDGSWYITYHGSQGNIYNKGPNIDIYQVDDQWYISAAVPDVSNFLTSAVGYESKALVLKDNVWVPADEANGNIVTINTYSSVSSFVDAHSGDIINTVNTYSSYSSYYNSTVDTVSSYSAYWNEVSSFSSHSGEFMHPSKLAYSPGTNIITGYDGSAFGDKDTNYVGIDGIKVDKDTFEIGISANFLSASDKYLSANSLDELSGKWEDTANTVSTASGSWNEVSGKQDILFLGDTLSGLGTSASPLHAKPIQIISNNGSITVSSNVSSGTSIFNIEAVNASGVSGSSLSLAYTMPIAAATQNVSLNAGTSTQWAAHATLITPFNNAILSSNSKIKISVPQVVSGGSLIFGLYSVDPDDDDIKLTHKRSTNPIPMPADYCYIEGTLVNGISTNLNVSDTNYLVVLTNSNGCAVKGTAGNNANYKPYTSLISNNLGPLTAAPSGFKIDGETSLNIYAEIIF